MIRFSSRTLVKVLAFTAVSAVFTVALLVKIGNLRLFADTYRLEAEFTDAAGIFKGDAVKLAGVDVGRVEGAHIEDGKAVVTFNVDEDVELTRQSVVSIRWRNVLGQRFLYVHPGGGGAPRLEDGDRIPASQTRPAGDIGDFLNRLGPILRAIDPEKANAFVDAVNTALSGNEVTVRQLLSNGAVLASELGEMDEQIRSLVESSATVMAAYASQDDAIGSMIDDLDSLGGRLRGMTGDVNSLLVNFAEVQFQLDRLLRENRGHIDASLVDLRNVSRTLQHNRANLEQTLCTLPMGLAGYFQTTSWGEWFNVRITRVIVKDHEGRTVASESEQPTQRDDRGPGVVTGCQGRIHLSGGDLPPVQGPGGEPGPPTARGARDDGFEDLGALVRFVVGGARV